MTNRALLAEVVAEHFGHHTREYVPVRRRNGDNDPKVIAARQAAIDIDHDEQDYHAA